MLATTLRTAGRVGSAAASRSALATSRAFAAIPTALEDWHVARGGKMVEFAGYSLPVLYEGPDSGVVKEHLATRADGSCTLFDVSHMGQLKWTGADRVKFIESVVVGDIAMLGDGEGKLSLITNASGGIIDDTVICNAGECVGRPRRAAPLPPPLSPPPPPPTATCTWSSTARASTATWPTSRSSWRRSTGTSPWSA